MLPVLLTSVITVLSVDLLLLRGGLVRKHPVAVRHDIDSLEKIFRICSACALFATRNKRATIVRCLLKAKYSNYFIDIGIYFSNNRSVIYLQSPKIRLF